MDPLLINSGICASVISVTWVLSLITKEYSWVDRIWSWMPEIYTFVYAYMQNFSNVRSNIVFGLTLLWGIRLTLNFARKGGYAKGGEDYRWAILRQKMSPLQFQIFNIFFISIYQNILIMIITLPALLVSKKSTPLTRLDYILTFAFLAFLTLETIADQQMWNFQQFKLTEKKAGREPKPRFVQNGLFRYSRHPNFFAEQAQWYVIYFFGVVASGKLLNWTGIGVVLLTFLFHGSTNMTEGISVSRYPEYADYQKKTSRLIPFFPKKSSPSQDKSRKQ